MITNLTREDLIEFEKEIASIFEQGLIKAPVHLRAGRENELISIFESVNKQDYIYGYWDSHELALLKGVPRNEVKQAILDGNSIALSFPEYGVLCSGIVGSLCGVAVGHAWALKQRQLQCHICHGEEKAQEFCSACVPQHVYHFCGDMSAETGIFHESVKYANNFDLPITFVVGDNGVSVMTETQKTWNSETPWFFLNNNYNKKIKYFTYRNSYPHSGLGKLIKF